MSETKASAGGKVPVLFVHTATDHPLGADTWVQALIMRHLDRSEFEVHVACAVGPPSRRTPTFQAVSALRGVTIHPVDFGPELFRRSPLQKASALVQTLPAAYHLAGLVRYVRQHGIRIIHTSDRPRDAFASVLLARLTSARTVIHVHVAYGDWMSKMLRWSMARADALVGVSSFVARTLTDAGYPPRKVHAVLNAVDVSAWNPSLDAQAARAEIRIPPGARVVTCVARVFPAKGQRELVRALAIVHRQIPEVRLLIVGQDYPAGTHFSKELAALAEQLGVSKNVQFLGQRSDIPRLLAASDVFALPSPNEPFGLAHAEAMAMKRPVVATRSGGTPEVVDHEKSGLLSEPGDVDGLASHLLRLLGDPALAARMGEHGRRRVEARFAPHIQAEAVARVYRAILAGP